MCVTGQFARVTYTEAVEILKDPKLAERFENEVKCIFAASIAVTPPARSYAPARS